MSPHRRHQSADLLNVQTSNDEFPATTSRNKTCLWYYNNNNDRASQLNSRTRIWDSCVFMLVNQFANLTTTQFLQITTRWRYISELHWQGLCSVFWFYWLVQNCQKTWTFRKGNINQHPITFWYSIHSGKTTQKNSSQEPMSSSIESQRLAVFLSFYTFTHYTFLNSPSKSLEQPTHLPFCILQSQIRKEQQGI